MEQTKVTLIGGGGFNVRSEFDYQGIARRLHENGYFPAIRLEESGLEIRVCLLLSAVAALYPADDWKD